VLARSGDLTSSWELAREFGFTDADGQPSDWGQQWQSIQSQKAYAWLREGMERHIKWLDRIARRTEGYLRDKPSAG